MPHWLLQLLVTLAVQFGIPWLLKAFPWLPKEVIAIIEELLKALQDQKMEKKALIKEAKQNIAACYGPNCPKE